MVKRISSMYMYHTFKKDVNFKLLPKEHLLEEKVPKYSTFHNFSILKMNDDFMEVIDQRYAWLGKGLGFSFFVTCVFFPLFLIIFNLYLSAVKDNIILLASFMCLFPIVFFLFLIFKRDRNKEICHPIIFNRINQKVYFYISDNEYIAKHWKDVVWVMSPSDGSGGTPIYEIQAHIVEDGIVKNTFLVGYPVIEERKNYGLWNFICHFMEQGPEQLYAYKNAHYSAGELATKLPYCHRLVGAKESYRDTWQAMRNIYKHNLFFRIWTLFLDIFYFFGRRVLLNLLPLPVWPEQVRIENEFDKVRPEQVDYQDNRE